MITNNLNMAYTQAYEARQSGQIKNEFTELSRVLEQNPFELVKESELLDKVKALNEYNTSHQVDKIRLIVLKQSLTEEVEDIRNLLDTSPSTFSSVKGELIAHWINISYETKNWSALKIENLTKEELQAAAPHLLYVHPKCTVNLDNQEMGSFLDSCRNATHLFLSGNEKVLYLKLTSYYLRELKSVHITDMPLLKKIECASGYMKTLHISNTPMLEWIDCSRSALTDFTLSNLPELKEINLSWTKLKELEMGEVPSVEKLELANCSELTAVKGSLAKCRHFDYRGCPKLKGPEDLPLTAWLGSGEVLHVDLKKLAENPVEVLLALGSTYSIKYRCLPNIEWTQKMNRHLIPTLCKHLFKKRISFPTAELFGGRMPLLKLNNVLALQTFGKLIAFCATSSTLMGNYLPNQFFNAIFAVTDEDSDKPLSDTLKKKLYCALSDIEDEEEFGEQDAAALKGETLSAALHACAIIAKELKNFIEDFDNWKTEPLAFSRLVQGKPVTEEALRHQLVYDSNSHRIEEKHVAEMKECFEDFIDQHPDKLTELVEFFTGNLALGYYKIKIMVEPEGSNFEVSWGNSEIEVPYFSNYSEFEKTLLNKIK